MNSPRKCICYFIYYIIFINTTHSAAHVFLFVLLVGLLAQQGIRRKEKPLTCFGSNAWHFSRRCYYRKLREKFIYSLLYFIIFYNFSRTHIYPSVLFFLGLWWAQSHKKNKTIAPPCFGGNAWHIRDEEGLIFTWDLF